MAQRTGIRRTLARGAGVVGAALLLWTSTAGEVLPGQEATAAHAAPAARMVQSSSRIAAGAGWRWGSAYAALVGTWLGPGLGDTGGCGKEYGQFTFFRNRQYAYTSNSQSCGGFTNAGYYWLQNGLIYLHWTTCNFPCTAGTAAAGFAFLGASAFQLNDQGRVYVYYRQ